MKKLNLILTQKIGFAALGLVAITVFTIFLSKKATELRLKQEEKKRKEPIIEGLSLDDIGDAFNKVPDAFNKAGNAIKDGVIGAVNDAENAIMGVVNDIMSVVNTIIKDIEGVFKGIPNLGNGIFNHWMCGAQEVKAGADNGLNIFGILISCAWDKNLKFWNGSCTRYYFVDLILGIFYGVFIELPLLLIYAITAIDMQFLVDLVIEIVVLPIDTVAFTLTGYHITSWPDSVIKNCYSCAGTIDLNDGNGKQTLHKTMGQWGSMLNCTTHQFIHGLAKIFTSTIPGPKWGAWYNGDNIKGGDDFPLYF